MWRFGEKRQLDKKQTERLFYLSLALLSVLAFLFLGHLDYYLIDDSESYMNLSSGMEGVMPIYPLFLHGNKLLFGENSYLYAAVAEQSVFAAACVMIFIRTIKKQFSLNYPESYICFFLSLLTFTADMPDVMTTRVILTEGIAYAAFYLFMAALLQAIWSKSWKWLGILCIVTLFMSSIRSQLQILFGVCGAACIYIALFRKKAGSKKKIPLSFFLGTIGGIVIGFVGILMTSQIAGRYQIAMSKMREQQAVAEAIETKEAENSDNAAEQIIVETETQESTGEQKSEQWVTPSQYVSLIFNKGMYEADYEDYQLFEDEQMRDLYLCLYKRIDEAGYRYSYAEPGLWMWKDIMGSALIGVECLKEEEQYYEEKNPELLDTSSYHVVRSHNWMVIGAALIKAHPGRFLYHTIMLLPQAFVSTVFFQIKRIYLLCHIITLFLYLSAIALTIWAYWNRKVKNAYGEFMLSVLGTNIIMVVIISVVFFGQKRYLFYNFGIFYVAYFLLLMQIWKQYGRELWMRKTKKI